ncbi:MAG: translocation/assembly module TamB domain-containing protein, partial [Sphingobacterium sp.]
KFFIDGEVIGFMDNIKIPRIEFKTLKNTHLIASATIKGLPEVEKLYLDLNIQKMVTGRTDLEQLIAPTLLPDSIKLPRNISLTGTFKGGMSGFDTDLKLNTEQGNATVNGTLAMAKDTTYQAFVSIENFNLGEFISQDSTLGFIAVQAQVKGTGLDPKHMTADATGKIDRFDAMGYEYHDIDFDIAANLGDIKGTLHSIDPNLDLDASFQADMQGKYPKLNAEMQIDSINFKNLKLMDQNLRYHGKIIADFETMDLDHLNGSIFVSNSSIAYNQDRYSLDTITLTAQADTNKNTILLNSEFLSAHLTGKYKLTELGSSISDIMRTYYNPSNNQEEYIYSPQEFEFSARFNRSRLISDFLPELEKMEDITLDGSFNSEDRILMAKLLAPQITYAGTEVEQVGLDIISADSTLYYNTLIGHIKVSGVELRNTVL